MDVGVIGVGSMGKHHVRVYSNHKDAELVGIADVEETRARKIADTHGTEVVEREDVIELADAVSIAVPTEHHYEVAVECVEAGVDVLIEKPFVKEIEHGEELIKLAEDNDVRIQVGHIERFNPAVMALEDILPGLNVIAFEARRLGPDPERDIKDSVVTDLMIHDIDIVRSLVGEEPSDVEAVGTGAGKHATATLSFENGQMAALSASRVTQQKIRELAIAAEECYVKIDYLNKDVEIHRDSAPEYITEGQGVRYRHESVIERPVIDNAEPLKNELTAFLEAVMEEDPPLVTAEDGLSAVRLSHTIEEDAFEVIE